MRNIFKFMLFIALGAMILVSCEEDQFTEKDAMESLQTIDMAFTIQDGSSHADGVEGATVKLLKDSASSSTVEKTTDGSGYVMFEDMKIGGDISVYVSKDNYTKATFTIDASTDSYRESQISKTLKIYSLDSDNLATVKGQLTLETDLTNRQREKLANQEVKVVNHDLGANIEKSFVGTTDEDGKYSIKVPVNADGGDNLEVNFPNRIDTTQTLAMQEGTYKVVSKPTVYYADHYDPTNIPFIPSAVATIDAPPETGSDFELGVEAKGTKFTEFDNNWQIEDNEIDVVQGGSGYHIENSADTTLPMSEGINNDTTWATVEISKSGADSSSITNIYVKPSNDMGLYTSAPTLDLSVLGGSDAILEVRFMNYHKLYIENNGTGYESIPEFSGTYKEYENETLVERNDIGESLDGVTKLHEGSIYPDNPSYSGDTITQFEAKEVIEISTSSTTGQQVKMKFNYDDIEPNGEDSTITDFYLDPNGEGYDPANPPEITVNSLKDYGSGAEFIVEVDTDGTISSADITQKAEGEGYVRNVNDYVNSGIDNPHYDWDGHGNPGRGHSTNISGNTNNVSPGDVLNQDIYYGTGVRQEEE
ncbi:MAG: hypothetical protein ACQER7_01890 [Bacteroidota bacterium]